MFYVVCGSSSFHLSQLIYTCTMFSYNKAAIIRSDGTILGESLASQHDIHEEWGGKQPSIWIRFYYDPSSKHFLLKV